jgi:mono/diheme cytochrome c family protein
MINSKSSLVLTLSLIAGLVLAGCGTQAAAEPAATGAPPTQPELVPTEVVESAPTDLPAEAPTEAPTDVPAEVPAATVSFANDVMPIIQSRCIRCHGEDRVEEGLLMRTYEELMAGSDNGPVIIPGNAAASLLVELVAELKMPKRGPKLTPPQIQIITDWVAAGAPNN